MPTVNEALLDAMIRHQVGLMRFSGGVRNQIFDLLNATERDMADRIRSRLLGNTGLNTSQAVRRLETTLAYVRTIRLKAWSQIDETWMRELVSLAQAEPEFISSAILTVSPVVVETLLPAPSRLRAIATSRPFEGRTLSAWAKRLADDDITRIENAIRVGMVAGESSAAIARRVVGTAALKGGDGVTEITRRGAASITRTAVNFIANEARTEFFKANSDLFSEEQFVATLDSRTTPVCRANDGKYFKIGEGPMPPLHWGCRSLRVPALLPEALGDRPAKPSTERQLVREFTDGKHSSRASLPYGQKGSYDNFARKRIREMTGRVPAATNYGTWLKSQSNEFQDEVLGKTKARLFRDGGLQLDRFVNRNGDELTLAQLATTDRAAFVAAGLDPSAF